MRSLLPSRTAGTALAVPALLLVLTGCGGGDTTPASGEVSGPPSASSTKAEASGEASPAPTGTGQASGGSWDEQTLVPAMLSAVEQHKSAHFTMTTTAGGLDMSAEGDMSLEGRSQEMVMVMDGSAFGADRLELRLVDGVMYLSMPPMTPTGKFAKIDDGASSPLAGLTTQMPGVDPRESFKAFEAGLEKVTFVGVEPVASEDLEHYRLTVDFRAVARAQGLPRVAGVPDTVTYDIWLDEDALMRRMELRMQQLSMVMEMSDWGEPVTIEAPARKDIVRAPAR